MGDTMTTGNLIGYRSNGRAIYLIQGGADDDAPEQGPSPAAPPAPPTWQPPNREDWEAAQTAQQRLAQLMAERSTDPGDDGEDDEEEPTASTQQSRDRSKPPTWEDFERIEGRQRKAAREAQQLRAERRRQQDAWAAEDARRKEDDDRKAAVLAAEQKARAEAEAMYRPATIRAAALPVLVQAGARGDRVDDLYAFLRQDELTVDGHKVDGLDEQVSALKARYPEWFQPAEERRPVPRVVTGDRAPVSEKPLTSAQIIARQILGGAA